MTDIERQDSDAFAKIVDYYELWRQIYELAGEQPKDKAAWENGRLYFPSDYSEKSREWPEWRTKGDWQAWIIEPAPEGYNNVVHSVMPERSSERSEKVEAVFSRPTDAGKYVLTNIGNFLRTKLGLNSVILAWNVQGLDPRIKVSPAGPHLLDYFLKIRPRTSREIASRHLKQYTLSDDPNRYGIALPSEEKYMQVLALSYEQLNSALLDGMPESITSKVPLWIQ